MNATVGIPGFGTGIGYGKTAAAAAAAIRYVPSAACGLGVNREACMRCLCSDHRGRESKYRLELPPEATTDVASWRIVTPQSCIPSRQRRTTAIIHQ